MSKLTQLLLNTIIPSQSIEHNLFIPYSNSQWKVAMISEKTERSDASDLSISRWSDTSGLHISKWSDASDLSISRWSDALGPPILKLFWGNIVILLQRNRMTRLALFFKLPSWRKMCFLATKKYKLVGQTCAAGLGIRL